MKTVSGTVISSTPISLAKATSVLSTFVSTENGASQAISAYLRRTLTAFKELKQLYKDLKSSTTSSHFGRKRKRRSSEITADADTDPAPSQSESKRKRHRL